jgi:exonuclease VII large subunit
MRINDFFLRRLALAVSIAGIIGLFWVAYFQEISEVEISEIDANFVSKNIITSGKISWEKKNDSAIIFTIEDIAKINAVKFSPNFADSEIIKTGNFVRVQGKVQIYKNLPEIVVSRIELIN